MLRKSRASIYTEALGVLTVSAVVDLKGLYEKAENIRQCSLSEIAELVVKSIITEVMIYNQKAMEQELLASVIEILDEFFIPIVAQDIQESNLIDHQASNAEESLYKLIDYYYISAQSIISDENEKINSENVAKFYFYYIKGKNPEFFERLTSVCDNLREFLSSFFRRVSNDKNIIYEAFLAEEKQVKKMSGDNKEGDFFVTSIEFLGSDFHMNNQQVLLISILDSRNNKKNKFIYKPFNLQLDAYLVGNIERANACGAEIDFDKSICEIVNEKLDGQLVYPSYLIIPRKDRNSNINFYSEKNKTTIEEHFIDDYGYIECLSHDPWPSMQNFRKDIKLQVLHKKAINVNVDALWYNALIRELSLKTTSDTDFLMEEQDVKNYWALCGMWSAFFLVFKIGDMHAENLIVSKKKPYPIDLEVCFDPKIKEISQLDCFKDDGSISVKGKGLFKTQILFGIQNNDCLIIKETIHDKNRVFFRNDKKIIPAPLDEQAIEKGFLVGFRAIMAQQEKIMLHANFLEEFYCRTLPFNTSTLNSMMNIYKKGVEIREDFFREFKVNLAKKNTDKMPSKKFIVVDDVFMTSLSTFNVPKFFIKLNQKYLYNSQGECLKFATGEIEETQKNFPDFSSEALNFYLEETPLNEFKSHFISLSAMSEEVLVEKLCLIFSPPSQVVSNQVNSENIVTKSASLR